MLEAISAFETASGKEVPFQFGPRRPGMFADNGVAIENFVKKLWLLVNKHATY